MLGKHYNYFTTIGRDQLNSAPYDELSRVVNDKIGSDLDHIEDGRFRGVMKAYKLEEKDISEHCEDLERMEEHLASSMELLKSMQQTYVDDMHVPMEEFDELNISMTEALEHVENTLSAGARAGNLKALGNAMGGLKRSMAVRENNGTLQGKDLEETKQLMDEYDNGRMLYDKVIKSIESVRKQREALLVHNEALHEKTEGRGDLVMNLEEQDRKATLLSVEQKMYDTFSKEETVSPFINPSKEDLIQEIFAETKEGIGVKEHTMTSGVKRVQRNKLMHDNYRQRLK